MRWPLGRLILQIFLLLALLVMCFGAGGIEGVIGWIFLLGVGISAYAIVKATR